MNSKSFAVSVALCTYNGARYLEDQLESIAAQALAPAELVVCDDCSTDDTVPILERFAGSAPFPVRIFRNERNLGSTKNFEKAIGLCGGDLIALCDQDDIWLCGKLSEVADTFARFPGAGLVFSDARVVDCALAPLGYRLWESRLLAVPSRETLRSDPGLLFRSLLRHNVVTGATMVFRRNHRNLVLPIPAEWIHDAWLALMLAAVSEAVPIADPLVDYRQHGQQQIGGRWAGLRSQVRTARRMGLERFALDCRRFEQVRERLSRRRVDTLPGVLEALAGKIKHCQARLSIRQASGPGTAFMTAVREAIHGAYGRYSLGWKSFGQDLFLS